MLLTKKYSYILFKKGKFKRGFKLFHARVIGSSFYFAKIGPLLATFLQLLKCKYRFGTFQLHARAQHGYTIHIYVLHLVVLGDYLGVFIHTVEVQY
jgi:hypothetical protein